ncbi:MAG: methyltransferase domain-containing protein [Lachnospiraceae bacterium]|nr:methyltransferase domain-containing protein [Lachnospiraceae bacterium]
MSHLENIPFEEEQEDIKFCVTNYWMKRAESFYEQRQHELASNKAARWLETFERATEGMENLNVLDVGSGAGFFEVLLGKMGHLVTGIDLTPEMVDKANRFIAQEHLPVDQVGAMVMDAENLRFEDESFDVIISRNLTWTLPHPVEAYQEWHRVLKPGGLLLNFDAEYAKGEHEANRPENLAHKCIPEEMKQECHEIYHMLTISTMNRPHWDKVVLKEVGFSQVDVDEEFYRKIFEEHDEFYIPDHMFMIRAVK